MIYLIIIYIINVIIARELNIRAIKSDSCNPNVWVFCLVPVINLLFIVVLFAEVLVSYHREHEIKLKIIKWFRGDYRINK